MNFLLLFSSVLFFISIILNPVCILSIQTEYIAQSARKIREQIWAQIRRFVFWYLRSDAFNTANNMYHGQSIFKHVIENFFFSTKYRIHTHTQSKNYASEMFVIHLRKPFRSKWHGKYLVGYFMARIILLFFFVMEKSILCIMKSKLFVNIWYVPDTKRKSFWFIQFSLVERWFGHFRRNTVISTN